MAMVQYDNSILLDIFSEVSQLSQEHYVEDRWNSLRSRLKSRLPKEALPIVEDYVIKIQLLKQKESYLNFMAKTFEIIQQINIEVSSLAPLDKILSLSADKLRSISKANIVLIALLNKEQNNIRIQVLSGANTDELLNYEQNIDKGITGIVAKLHKPYVVSDYKQYKDPIDPLAQKLIEREGIRSIIASPLLLNNQLLGIVFIARQKPYNSSDLLIKMLEHYCYQAAIAIDNARLYGNELRITNLHKELFKEALNSGYSGIIQKLSKFINEPILLMDEYGNIIHDYYPSRVKDRTSETSFHYTHIFEKIKAIKNGLKKSTELHITNDSCITVFPILLNEMTIAYLIVPRAYNEHDNLDIVAIEQSKNVIALKISQERTSTEIEMRLRQEYLYDLILGLELEEDLLRRGRFLKFDFRNSYHILILSPSAESNNSELNSNQTNQILEKIRYSLGVSSLPLSIVHGEKLIVLTQSSQTAGIAKDILASYKKYSSGFNATIGISNSVKEPPEYAKGYSDAKKAAEFAHLFGRQNEIIYYDDLGIIGVLFESNNFESMKLYSEKYLGTLIEYDTIHNADLIKSLQAFLDNESVIQSSATQLHVHYNTLRYRLNRIEDITGLSLSNTQNKLNLRISLMIHQLLTKMNSN
ncbi:helix-turn-helix domain-containing protein [Bacillus sp. JJ722]|uniref:helix-turn-helix domain-containing protein n=1 Tax=Bacillus sp. JJ722 TaxID=3122973 RepID=UPI002FFDE53D